MRSWLLIPVLALGLVLGLAAPSAARSDMTLDAFVTQANRIPMNATAMLRADARRLVGEFRSAFRIAGERNQANRAAGRAPMACPPERIDVNPREMLAYLNTIPQARRARMDVADGLHAWMTDRYPCPAA